jgi:hypothetical protein
MCCNDRIFYRSLFIQTRGVLKKLFDHSSASCRSVAGTPKPKALAVLRLMASSNLFGNCTAAARR